MKTLDKARKTTDKKLSAMEKDIHKQYKFAGAEIEKQWNKYMTDGAKDFEKLHKAYMTAEPAEKAVAKKAYETALREYTLENRKYKNLVAQTTKEIANVNSKALKGVNAQQASIYATNYNFTVNQANMTLATNFDLVNENTVARLITRKNLLPQKVLNVPKDMRWNAKQINSSVLQGILRGESVYKIADRLKPIMNRNEASAIRNARTIVTGAENRGRLDSMQYLQDEGIVLKKKWIATADENTRDWHLEMDGQEVELDENFVDGNGNELEYPGDPNGEPETVYNCRCTMETVIIGFTNENGDITYLDESLHSDTGHRDRIEDEMERRGIDVSSEPEPEEKSEFLTNLEAWNIEYKEVELLPRKLSDDQIIEKLGGGDRTRGSCASLSFAYAGNKNGYDVTDFRGGDSQGFFSKTGNIKGIATLKNVESKIVSDFNDFKAVKEVVKDLPKNKEYILAAGKHAAIIKRTEEGFKYLELQSATQNGFKPLNDQVLKRRFGCQKSHTIAGQKYATNTMAIDVDSLGKNSEYREILGYLNTATDKQKKGVGGYAK